MMIKIPHEYFMQDPNTNSFSDKPINKTIEKIKKIASRGLPTDDLVIKLRQKIAMTTEERQQIAKITNKMENDPFPEFDEIQRAEVAEFLYELLQMIIEQRLVEFLQKFELLSSDVKWALYQEIELAGGDLLSLVKSLDIKTIREQKKPLALALAQLAELAVTKGARSPYLTSAELEQMEEDFKGF